MSAEIVETIHAACSNQQLIQAQYGKLGEKVSSFRILKPFFLKYREGALYLIAEDLSAKKMKTFSLSRFKTVKMLDESSERESKEFPQDYSKHSFGAFHSQVSPSNVVIRLTSPISQYVCERQWHPSQKITVIENSDEVEISFYVGITPELLQWVLRWGQHAVVVEPEELRLQIVESVKANLANYLRRLVAA